MEKKGCKHSIWHAKARCEESKTTPKIFYAWENKRKVKGGSK